LTKSEIEQRITELKMDYVRIQGDIEKLESVGHSPTKAEQMLEEIENELKELRTLLEEK